MCIYIYIYIYPELLLRVKNKNVVKQVLLNYFLQYTRCNTYFYNIVVSCLCKLFSNFIVNLCLGLLLIVSQHYC